MAKENWHHLRFPEPHIHFARHATHGRQIQHSKQEEAFFSPGLLSQGNSGINGITEKTLPRKKKEKKKEPRRRQRQRRRRSWVIEPEVKQQRADGLSLSGMRASVNAKNPFPVSSHSWDLGGFKSNILSGYSVTRADCFSAVFSETLMQEVSAPTQFLSVTPPRKQPRC